MKKLLSMLAIGMITTTSVSTINTSINTNSNSNNLTNIKSDISKLVKFNSETKQFSDCAIVTEEHGVVEKDLDINISYKTLQTLDTNSKIESFVENIKYYDNKGNDVDTNSIWVNWLKRDLKIIIKDNILKLKVNTNNDGVVMKIFHDHPLNSDHDFICGAILPFINYVKNKNDWIEKDYRFLAHDLLKVKISTETWKYLLTIKNNKDSKQQLLTTFTIFSLFTMYDNTGWGGSIDSSDINTLAEIISSHFSDINEVYNKLESGQSLLIKTNTIGSWDKSDDMGVFAN